LYYLDLHPYRYCRKTRKKNKTARTILNMSRYFEQPKYYQPQGPYGFSLQYPEQFNLAVHNVAEIRGFFTRFLPVIENRMELQKIPFKERLAFEKAYRPSKLRKANVQQYIDVLVHWLPDHFYFKPRSSSLSGTTSNEDSLSE
jgi:hypothetical protein